MCFHPDLSLSLSFSLHARLTPTELSSVSPTATPTTTGTSAGPQLSPHQLTPSLQHVGNMNALHAMLPFSIPPPPPHAHNLGVGMGMGLGSSAWPASWYELVLPPDRYLDHARNVELTVQPEQLLCHRKYDNLSMDIWKRFCGAQQTHAKFKLKMRLWRYLFIWINVSANKYKKRKEIFMDIFLSSLCSNQSSHAIASALWDRPLQDLAPTHPTLICASCRSIKRSNRNSISSSIIITVNFVPRH